VFRVQCRVQSLVIFIIAFRGWVRQYRYPSVVVRNHHCIRVVREDQAVEPHRVILGLAVFGVRSERHRARVDPRLEGLVCAPEVLSAHVLRLIDNQKLTAGSPVVVGSIGTNKTRLQERDRDPDKINGNPVYPLSKYPRTRLKHNI